MPWHRNKETQPTPPYKRSMRLGVTDGNIINNWIGSGGNDTLAVTADVLYAVPLFLPETIRVYAITLEVTTAGAAGSMRIGLYRDSGGYPGTLVNTETEITTPDATGVKRQLIQMTLPCGFYWGAASFSTTPTVRSDILSGGIFWLGQDSGNDTITAHTGISVSRAHAALPATFTAGAVLSATDMPRVLMIIGKFGTLP